MKYQELKTKILKELQHLCKLEPNQIFNSKYYDDIVAVKITPLENNIYHVYGFDIKEGLPRSNYYPRDLSLVGKDPVLSDILLWFKLQNYKYAHFENNYFCVYDSEETYKIEWNLTNHYLKEQSEELIDFLLEISE